MFSKKLCGQLLDGSLTDHGNYVSGVCKGFYVTINTTENGMYSIKISAHSENDPGNSMLRSFVESRKNVTNQIQSVNVYDNSVTIVSNRTFLIKKVPAHLNEAVMPIIDYLAQNYYSSGCMECGTQYAPVDCYDVNGSHHYLCAECAEKIVGALEDRKQGVLAKKSRFVPGIVGALLGSMLGCVVYFLLWQLGYIAAIAGLVTAVCAFKGYEWLGGVVDRKGVVACVIVIIFAVYFSNKLVWSYDAYTAFRDYYDDVTFFDCFRAIGDLVDELDLKGEYYGNLAMAYVLTAIGSVGSIIRAFKASSGSYKVKKMKN